MAEDHDIEVVKEVLSERYDVPCKHEPMEGRVFEVSRYTDVHASISREIPGSEAIVRVCRKCKVLYFEERKVLHYEEA